MRLCDFKKLLIFGVLVVVLGNIVHIVVGVVTIPLFFIGIFILFLFGLVELLYVVPLAVMAKNAGELQRLKGIIIAASAGFLLTCACLGLTLL